MAPMAKRNRFSNTWDNLFTCNMGKLICYDVIPVLPNDYMHVIHEQITKAQALTAPAYGKFNVKLMDIYVPTRLLWDDWEEYWASALDGTTNELVQLVHPYMTTSVSRIAPSDADRYKLTDPNDFTYGYNIGSTADYLGIPLNCATKHSAFWHRGIAKCINDWFINEDVEDPVPLSTAGGLDNTTYRGLFNMNHKRDYFTNALPWQTKGDPVGLPLNQASSMDIVDTGGLRFKTSQGDRVGQIQNPSSITAGQSGDIKLKTITGTDDWSSNSVLRYKDGLGIQLTGNFANMTDLAIAQQLNRLFMMNARTGSRYIEKLLANYGVRSSDARLQRSEFLGGSKSTMLVSEILQTSGTVAGSTPQGNQAGHLYGVGRSRGWSKTFEEFGYVFCFYVIAPKAVYSEGMPRELMKKDALEYAIPMLSHLPETVIYNGELKWTSDDRSVIGGDSGGTYTDVDDAINYTGFGFHPQYDEYRHHYSRCAANFRPYIYTSGSGTDLDPYVAHGGDMADWTFARSFATLPTLSKEFIECEDIRRPFATEGTKDHLFMVNVTTNCRVRRCLPKKGLPAGTF